MTYTCDKGEAGFMLSAVAFFRYVQAGSHVLREEYIFREVKIFVFIF